MSEFPCVFVKISVYGSPSISPWKSRPILLQYLFYFWFWNNAENSVCFQNSTQILSYSQKNFLSHTVKFDYGKSHNTLHSSAFYLHICVSYQSYLTITFCEDITLRPVNLISITIGASLFYVVKLIRISQDIGK